MRHHEHETEYVDANTAYCHDCDEHVPMAHACSLGDTFVPEELDENEMNHSGGVEMVDSTVGAYAQDGVTVEFDMVLEVRAAFEVDDDGELTDVYGETV